MKKLLFSDLHVYPYNEFSKIINSRGETDLLLECRDSCTWISEQILKYKPDVVGNLGDTALTHGYLDALSLGCIYDGYHEINEACQTTGSILYWMLGNHDFLNHTTRIHTLPFVCSNLVVNPISVDKLLLIPYIKNLDSLSELLNSDYEEAWLHVDIRGAQLNSTGIESRSGLDPSIIRKGYSGHYHTPHRINNIQVIGSLMNRSFSDGNHIKGAFYIDGDNYQFLPNPHTSFYTSVKIRCDKDIEKLLSIENRSRTYLRIQYPISMDKEIDLSIEGFKGIRKVPVESESKNVVAVSVDMSVDPLSILEEYIRHKPTSSESREYGKSVLNQALAKLNSSSSGQIVTFKHLHIENFLSIGSIDLPLDDPGVLYVEGEIHGNKMDRSNGAGKSSVFEALHWVLWGSMTRGATADNVVNDLVGKDCIVSATLCTNDTYIITRTRLHSIYGNSLKLYKNGDLISDGIAPTQKIIDKILSCNSTVFRHTTLLVDSLNTRFSTLPDRGKKEIIEDVLMIQVYEDAYNIVHEKAKKLRDMILSYTNEINSVEMSSNHLTIQKENVDSTWISRKADIDSQIKDLEARISSTLSEKYDCEGMMREYEYSLSELKQEIDKANSSEEICPTCNRPMRDTAKLESLNNAYRSIESTYLKIRSDISQKVSLIHSLTTIEDNLKKEIQHNESISSSFDSKLQELKTKSIELLTKRTFATLDLEYATYWEHAFSIEGCRVWLLGEALKIMNRSLSDYCSMISDGEISASLSAMNDVICLDVKTPGGTYVKSSSGERRMVDLSVQLSLSDLSSHYSGFSSNLCILDEVDFALDSAHRRRLIGMLQEISNRTGKTIFIASHHKDVRVLADKILTVVKENGISSLVSN